MHVAADSQHGCAPAILRVRPRLPVHRNTMLQRVQRIEATTGLDLRRINDQVLIALALSPAGGSGAL